MTGPRPRDHDLFLRWGRLAFDRRQRARAEAPVSASILSAAWTQAARIIAARTALAAVREGLVSGVVMDHRLCVQDLGELPLAARGPFELHEPDLTAPVDEVLRRPDALWEFIARHAGLDTEARTRIEHELMDSTFNLGLALTERTLREAWIRPGAVGPHLDGPDHWVVIGHPWHPMTKTRLGLGLRENLLFAPEHLARAPIEAVDVLRSHAQWFGDYEHVMKELFPSPAPDWIRIPVHGGQRRRLPALFPEAWGKSIVPAPVKTHFGRALLSVRTVALDSAPADFPFHLKLALAVHTTSAMRLVSPMSVRNGPVVSRLLSTIQANDGETAPTTFRIMAEPCSAGLHPERFPDRAAHLGVLLRPIEALRLAPEDRLVVCAALGERAPGRSTTMLQRLAVATGSEVDEARTFIRNYLILLVPPLLRLACAHGIALEPHLQNVLAVVRADQLRGFVVRDLGGIRIHRERLRKAGHHVDLAPDSFIVTDSSSDLRDKIAHCLFHAHLSTLFGWARDQLGLDPHWCWSETRFVVASTLNRWSEREPNLRSVCIDDRNAYLAPTVAAKALFTMRIQDRSSDYATIMVSNALAGATDQT